LSVYLKKTFHLCTQAPYHLNINKGEGPAAVDIWMGELLGVLEDMFVDVDACGGVDGSA